MVALIMDFRDTHCIWCDRRRGPAEDCAPCPKYRMYNNGEDIVLNEWSFCSICVNRDNEDLSVFCTTNRRLQHGSGEPFDCYKFCLNTKTGK